MIWHSHTVDDVLQELHVDPALGLTEQEAAERLKEYGNNSLPEGHALSFRAMLVEQLRHPFTVILLVISICTLVLDLYKQILQNTDTDWEQSLWVAGITLCGVLIRSLWRFHTHITMAKLSTLSSTEACVRRNGKKQTCTTHTLVPGDIILLDVGDIVPADCRLIKTTDLHCDENDLVNTTMPTEKTADAVFDDITPLAQRTNMLYAGTIITTGAAEAVVVATGVRSEMGHSAARGKRQSFETSTSKVTKKRNKVWTYASLILCVMALVVGFIVQPDHSAVVLTVTSLVMAMTPTNLDDVTMQLAADSIRRVARRKIKLLRAEALENLSKITVICTESETLFRNEEVSLDRAYINATSSSISFSGVLPKVRGIDPLMRMAVLNSTAGIPLDDAILELAARSGIHRDEILVDMPRIGELFSTDNRHTSVHLAGEQTLIVVSGKWNSLLPLCTNGDMDKLTNEAIAMETDCLQVVAIAYRLDDIAPTVYTSEELERNLICIGLFGYRMPWQDELGGITDSTASIRTVLFSNDSVASAVAVAKHAGFALHPKAATADTVAAFSDSDWDDAVKQYDVYCGLNDEQKRQIVTALQCQGEAVAVTASRSEDAELLAVADVGYTCGPLATDVAKKAADILLTDGSYSALLASIKEGKRLNILTMVILVYLVICSLVMFSIGFVGLVGWMPLQCQAVLLVCLHLLLMTIFPCLALLIVRISKRN